jgi:DNA topoisomerase-1
MSKPLVIVESPAKAKTIAGFLGSDFVVESSIGHIRDLPRNAADVPGALKGEPWARLGVDVENGFKPLYVVAREKRDQVNKLKALVRDASEVYLATDEDREGESIAWHLLEVLSPQVPVKRMVFHEITRGAIERAVQDWRELDRRLVDAQEARRILDRLYGYEVSPVLWKKVMPRLSAGRVQSVATRMLVERERARMRFRSAAWWGLDATFAKDGATFGAVLAAVGGRRLADGKSFTEDGHLRPEAAGVVVLDEAGATGLAARLSQSDFVVRSVEEKPYTDRPKPPFMTSTLQQAAGSKLRFAAQRTMQTAQRLYENGHITYMRTDSTTLSQTALAAAREQAKQLYGPDTVPSSPRQYQRKVKNAQEAHEAIRPAGDTFRHPREVARQVGPDEARLYDLIWRRTVASQMKDATGLTVTVRLGGTSSTGEDAEFSSGGTVITFTGFRRAYEEGADHVEGSATGTGTGADGDQERRLPPLAEGDDVDPQGFEAAAHSTKAPARFTEASLVKALEEMGVGRPSTYASILGTIQNRGYVWKKGTALVPSFVAFAVVGLLERHFGELVDYGFTASMEDDLDAIATGNEEAVPWLTRFYFGNGTPGLRPMVSDHLGEIDAREVNSIPLGTDEQDRLTVVRVGRYGPYVQRGDDRASVPEDMAPDELTLARAAELLEAPSDDRALGTDPGSGLTVLVRSGRYGPYVQLGQEETADGEATAASKGRGNGAKAPKPARVSLLKSMTPANVTLEDALRLLTLPRTLGTDPSSGEEVVALLGRYGPYVKKGSDSRTLGSEEQLFDVTLEEALAIFSEPKRWGRGGSAAPGRELGPDPATSRPMTIKNGRFGAYVTDGEVNASLPKAETAETISAERAAELLAEKRAKSAADPTTKAKSRPKAKKAAKAKTAKTAKKAKKAAPARKAAKPVKKAAKQARKTKAATVAKAASRAGTAKKTHTAETAGSSQASEPSKAARFAKAVRAAKAAKS